MMKRTGFYPNMIALNTLLRKEVLRFMRIWTQTILPPAITMSLYFLIFGKFIGSQIHQINGYQYIQYIVPGLIMMSIMTNAYSNTSASFFLVKFTKSIEEMLVSPMPNIIILLGFTLGGTLRGLLVGVVVLLVALLFTSVPIMHPMVVLTMAVLASALFSLGGLINGIFAKRFDDIAFVPTFVLTPLTYLGGVFYSINELPPVWRSISRFNPVLDIVNTFRFGMLGVSDLSVSFGFTLVSVLFVTMFACAYLLLIKGTGIKV